MTSDDAEYGVVDACPQCDAGSAAIYHRTSDLCKPQRSTEPNKDWYCPNCHRAFDHPNQRPRKHPGGYPSGTLAKRLAKTDPSAVTGDTQ